MASTLETDAAALAPAQSYAYAQRALIAGLPRLPAATMPSKIQNKHLKGICARLSREELDLSPPRAPCLAKDNHKMAIAGSSWRQENMCHLTHLLSFPGSPAPSFSFARALCVGVSRAFTAAAGDGKGALN